MKTSYLIVCVLLILSGCSNNTDEIISTTQNETENKVEKDYQKALDLVKEFAEKVNRPKSKSFDFSAVEIKNVEKSSLPIKFTKEMPTVAKSKGIDMKESVDIYTFQFIKDGKEGFAIATDDPRHPTVLAYIEEGKLADTVENSAPAFVFRNIKNIVLSDINRYYGEKLLPQAKTKVIYQNWQFQPILTTKWTTNSPYNNNYHKPSGSSCTSTENGKYPASYTAIALAQCIAAYPIDRVFQLDLPTLLTNKYNVRAFASTPTITPTSSHASKVAQFVREFDSSQTTGGFTTFQCGGFGTKTTLNWANIGLNNVGLSRDYYRYNGTSTKLSKFVEYIVKACRFDCRP